MPYPPFRCFAGENTSCCDQRDNCHALSDRHALERKPDHRGRSSAIRGSSSRRPSHAAENGSRRARPEVRCLVTGRFRERMTRQPVQAVRGPRREESYVDSPFAQVEDLAPNPLWVGPETPARGTRSGLSGVLSGESCSTLCSYPGWLAGWQRGPKAKREAGPSHAAAWEPCRSGGGP